MEAALSELAAAESRLQRGDALAGGRGPPPEPPPRAPAPKDFVKQIADQVLRSGACAEQLRHLVQDAVREAASEWKEGRDVSGVKTANPASVDHQAPAADLVLRVSKLETDWGHQRAGAQAARQFAALLEEETEGSFGSLQCSLAEAELALHDLGGSIRGAPPAGAGGGLERRVRKVAGHVQSASGSTEALRHRALSLASAAGPAAQRGDSPSTADEVARLAQRLHNVETASEAQLARLESEAAQCHNPVRSALRLTVSTSLCSARAASPKEDVVKALKSCIGTGKRFHTRATRMKFVEGKKLQVLVGKINGVVATVNDLSDDCSRCRLAAASSQAAVGSLVAAEGGWREPVAAALGRLAILEESTSAGGEATVARLEALEQKEAGTAQRVVDLRGGVAGCQLRLADQDAARDSSRARLAAAETAARESAAALRERAAAVEGKSCELAGEVSRLRGQLHTVSQTAAVGTRALLQQLEAEGRERVCEEQLAGARALLAELSAEDGPGRLVRVEEVSRLRSQLHAASETAAAGTRALLQELEAEGRERVRDEQSAESRALLAQLSQARAAAGDRPGERACEEVSHLRSQLHAVRETSVAGTRALLRQLEAEGRARVCAEQSAGAHALLAGEEKYGKLAGEVSHLRSQLHAAGETAAAGTRALLQQLEAERRARARDEQASAREEVSQLCSQLHAVRETSAAGARALLRQLEAEGRARVCAEQSAGAHAMLAGVSWRAEFDGAKDRLRRELACEASRSEEEARGGECRRKDAAAATQAVLREACEQLAAHDSSITSLHALVGEQAAWAESFTADHAAALRHVDDRIAVLQSNARLGENAVASLAEESRRISAGLERDVARVTAELDDVHAALARCSEDAVGERQRNEVRWDNLDADLSEKADVARVEWEAVKRRLRAHEDFFENEQSPALPADVSSRLAALEAAVQNQGAPGGPALLSPPREGAETKLQQQLARRVAMLEQSPTLPADVSSRLAALEDTAKTWPQGAPAPPLPLAESAVKLQQMQQQLARRVSMLEQLSALPADVSSRLAALEDAVQNRPQGAPGGPALLSPPREGAETKLQQQLARRVAMLEQSPTLPVEVSSRLAALENAVQNRPQGAPGGPALLSPPREGAETKLQQQLARRVAMLEQSPTCVPAEVSSRLAALEDAGPRNRPQGAPGGPAPPLQHEGAETKLQDLLQQLARRVAALEQPPVMPADVSSRLAALEDAAKAGAAPTLPQPESAAQLQQLHTRLAILEQSPVLPAEVSSRLAALEDAVQNRPQGGPAPPPLQHEGAETKLQDLLQQIARRVAALEQPPVMPADVSSRLAALEDAVQNRPQGGPALLLPQREGAETKLQQLHTRLAVLEQSPVLPAEVSSRLAALEDAAKARPRGAPGPAPPPPQPESAAKLQQLQQQLVDVGGGLRATTRSADATALRLALVEKRVHDAVEAARHATCAVEVSDRRLQFVEDRLAQDSEQAADDPGSSDLFAPSRGKTKPSATNGSDAKDVSWEVKRAVDALSLRVTACEGRMERGLGSEQPGADLTAPSRRETKRSATNGSDAKDVPREVKRAVDALSVRVTACEGRMERGVAGVEGVKLQVAQMFEAVAEVAAEQEASASGVHEEVEELRNASKHDIARLRELVGSPSDVLQRISAAEDLVADKLSEFREQWGAVLDAAISAHHRDAGQRQLEQVQALVKRVEAVEELGSALNGNERCLAGVQDLVSNRLSEFRDQCAREQQKFAAKLAESTGRRLEEFEARANEPAAACGGREGGAGGRGDAQAAFLQRQLRSTTERVSDLQDHARRVDDSLRRLASSMRFDHPAKTAPHATPTAPPDPCSPPSVPRFPDVAGASPAPSDTPDWLCPVDPTSGSGAAPALRAFALKADFREFAAAVWKAVDDLSDRLAYVCATGREKSQKNPDAESRRLLLREVEDARREAGESRGFAQALAHDVRQLQSVTVPRHVFDDAFQQLNAQTNDLLRWVQRLQTAVDAREPQET
ncbi:hypothetical protein DIPPA_35942 [Diplonema papillatum]|nr:hypothetical protein DIPPA_35942 [Diplonema papillatum]